MTDKDVKSEDESPLEAQRLLAAAQSEIEALSEALSVRRAGGPNTRRGPHRHMNEMQEKGQAIGTRNGASSTSDTSGSARLWSTVDCSWSEVK